MSLGGEKILANVIEKRQFQEKIHHWDSDPSFVIRKSFRKLTKNLIQSKAARLSRSRRPVGMAGTCRSEKARVT